MHVLMTSELSVDLPKDFPTKNFQRWDFSRLGHGSGEEKSLGKPWERRLFLYVSEMQHAHIVNNAACCTSKEDNWEGCNHTKTG